MAQSNFKSVKNPEPNIDHPDWVVWTERKKLNFLEKKLRAKLKKVIIYRV